MQPIPLFIQKSVDEYMELHRQAKEIEGKLSDLKEVINPFLDTVERIQCTTGGAVVRQVSLRPVMNALYTSYELKDIEEYLTARTKRLVVAQRVDAKNLESAVTLGQLPKEILNHKIVTETKSLVVKK